MPFLSRFSKEPTTPSDTPNPEVLSSAIPPAETKKKEKRRKGFRASLRSFFFGNIARTSSEPSDDISTVPGTKTLLTKIQLGKMGKYELFTEAIDLFQTLGDLNASSKPAPLEEILARITDVVEILKVVVVTKQVWRKRIVSVEQHQNMFTAQLVQLNEGPAVRQAKKLLLVLGQYVDALERVAAKIMQDVDVPGKDSPGDSSSTRIEGFIRRVLDTYSTEGAEDYMLQLLNAMDAFQHELVANIGETLNRVDIQGPLVDLRAKGLDESFIVQQGVTIHDMNAFGMQHTSCMKGTRDDVLEEIRNWYQLEDKRKPIYLIEDAAGTGKSTIARTLVQEWSSGECLAFFFPISPVQGATDLCFFLAQRIRTCCRSPDLDEYWDPISSSLSQLRVLQIEDQWERLVYEPMIKCTHHSRHLLIVDALDQCDEQSREALLKCLLNARPSRPGPQLRILFTTRSEPGISKVLPEKDLIIRRTLRGSTNELKDIAHYINHNLDEMNVFISDPRQRAVLVENCEERFVFAVVACKLLGEVRSENQSLEDTLVHFTSLESLYHHALSRAAPAPTVTRELLKCILRAILVAQEPLSIASISSLLSIPTEQVAAFVKRLEPILVSGEMDDPVYFRHATIADYLTSSKGGEGTAGNEWFITRNDGNRALAIGCLSILRNELKFNLCNTKSPNPTIPEEYEAMKQEIGKETTSALQYAAMAWIAHVTSELDDQQICEGLRLFFQQKLLNWLEFGGISRILPYFLLCLCQLQLAMETAHSMPNKLITKGDLQWTKDIIEFLLCNQTLLQVHPLHVYTSSLMFIPRENQVYRHYFPQVQQQVPTMLWGNPRSIQSSHALIGHTENVNRVAYSSEGDLIITATWGGEIIVWDAQSGSRLSTFRLADVKWGCLGLGFLPGNTVIMSVWEDGRLYRFSRETMQLLCPPEDMKIDTRWARVAWTKDWSRIACGTKDGKVHHFKLGTALEIGHVLEAHDMEINTVSFSWDHQKMACTSADKTFSIWNVDSGWPSFFWRNSAEIWDGAFSPTDSSLFAFVDGKSLSIYNVTKKVMVFQATELYPKAMVYSHSGDQIAVHAGRSTHIVNLYQSDKGGSPIPLDLNVVSPRAMTSCPMIVELDTGSLSSMAFSPDGRLLVTSGWDNIPRVHNIEQAHEQKAGSGHQSRVRYITFSHSGKRLASVDAEGRICIWNAESGRTKDPVTTDKKNTVAALSSDGLILAYAADMGDIRFWDTERHNPIGPRVSIGNAWEMDINAMSFSPSGFKLALTAGRPQSSILAILHLGGMHEIVTITAVTTDISPSLLSKFLAFHPGGEYVCCGNRVWGLKPKELIPAPGKIIPEILGQTSPSLVRFDYPYTSPLPSISLGPMRQVFYLPKSLDCYTYNRNDGLVAVGTDNGRVIVFDLTHLLTEDEKLMLDKICEMRNHESPRHGPTIYDTLSAHMGPANLLVTI